MLATAWDGQAGATSHRLELALACRRRDTLGAAAAAGRRSTLQPAAAPHRLSVAADNAGLAAGSPGWALNRHSLGLHGRRSSVAPSRLSTSAGHGMLSRLSLGLTDALHWLGIKGKIPTAAASEGQQPAAATHVGAGTAAAAVLDRPALSPIASPGLEEGSESPAEPSPLLGAAAAPAEQEQEEEEQQGPAEVAAAPGAALALAAQAAQLGVHSPAPSQHVAVGEQPAPAAEPEAEAAPLGAAAAQPGDAAAVEQLGQQLKETLQLQAADAEAAAEDASAEAEAGADEAATEGAALAEAASAAPEEDLTPLQQLLALCGQEVRRPHAREVLCNTHVLHRGCTCLLPAVPAALTWCGSGTWGLSTVSGLSVPVVVMRCARRAPCARSLQTDPGLLPSMDELLGRHVDLKKVRKIGEGEPLCAGPGAVERMWCLATAILGCVAARGAAMRARCIASCAWCSAPVSQPPGAA